MRRTPELPYNGDVSKLAETYRDMKDCWEDTETGSTNIKEPVLSWVFLRVYFSSFFFLLDG